MSKFSKDHLILGGFKGWDWVEHLTTPPAGSSTRGPNPFESQHCPLERVKKDIACEFYKLQSIVGNLEFETVGRGASSQARREDKTRDGMDSRADLLTHDDLIRDHMDREVADSGALKMLNNDAFQADISGVTKITAKSETVARGISFVTLLVHNSLKTPKFK